jgi:glycerophosphoryl diester phosphodiesterase
MLLLGHRGCRGEFTENTFAAFDHALDSGCDGFEFDVRLTADGVPVVWHDARLRGRFISRQNFGSLRERCLTPGRLPRRRTIALCELEAVLSRYAQVAWMDIELKVVGVEAHVAGLLRRYRPARGFVVSSFRQRVLLELHRIDPSLPLAFIFDRMPRAAVWRALPVEYVKPSARLVTAARVRQFHAEGKKVLTWTVNHPSAMRRLTEAGVDGMIGDDPVLMASGR